jgi:hypothetical protein
VTLHRQYLGIDEFRPCGQEAKRSKMDGRINQVSRMLQNPQRARKLRSTHKANPPVWAKNTLA